SQPGPDRGMVFQRDNLFPWLTVRDNVRFGSRLKAGRRFFAGSNARAVEQRCDRLLDAVGLTGFASAYPHELSGGMRQRAALVLASLYSRERRSLSEAALDKMLR